MDIGPGSNDILEVMVLHKLYTPFLISGWKTAFQDDLSIDKSKCHDNAQLLTITARNTVLSILCNAKLLTALCLE